MLASQYYWFAAWSIEMTVPCWYFNRFTESSVEMSFFNAFFPYNTNTAYNTNIVYKTKFLTMHNTIYNIVSSSSLLSFPKVTYNEHRLQKGSQSRQVVLRTHK